MGNWNPSGRRAVADIGLGLRVDRAAGDCQGAANVPIFNIEGGRVLMTLLLGEVTTEIAAGANNFKLQLNPDTGTTTDLCANLDIDADAIGTLYTVHGTPGTALQTGQHGNVLGPNAPVVLAAGAIECASAGNVAGEMKWSIWYLPLDDGAYVVAA